jgi:hypothetical protein
MPEQIPYRTTELEIASFLKAHGHRLLGAKLQNRLVEFEYEPLAQADVEQYFQGASISARELFEAHRSLRALIQQVKEHNRIRSEERTWNSYRQ